MFLFAGVYANCILLCKSVLQHLILCTTRTVTSHCSRVLVIPLLLCYLIPRAMTRDLVYKVKRPTLTLTRTAAEEVTTYNAYIGMGGSLSTGLRIVD